jgi:hypothetical protein
MSRGSDLDRNTTLQQPDADKSGGASIGARDIPSLWGGSSEWVVARHRTGFVGVKLTEEMVRGYG